MMKSLNNLLLLGDGETWSRQKIDFAGLPQMVQTFLQVAAGAADIPVTRLLGQSPAGLSATGDSDTRNYYDMIAARQAIDLRPKLERLDQLILRSAGVDPANVSFDFRPLWQMDAAAAAQIALNKAQTTQIYAGLKLWPADVMARLVESQLGEDGVYPGAEAIFAAEKVGAGIVADVGGAASGNRLGNIKDFFNPAELRNLLGRWAKEGGLASPLPVIPVDDPDEQKLKAADPTNAVEKVEDLQAVEKQKDLEFITRNFFGTHVRPDGTIELGVPQIVGKPVESAVTLAPPSAAAPSKPAIEPLVRAAAPSLPSSLSLSLPSSLIVAPPPLSSIRICLGLSALDHMLTILYLLNPLVDSVRNKQGKITRMVTCGDATDVVPRILEPNQAILSVITNGQRR